jgi:signal transduction histidine kinase
MGGTGLGLPQVYGFLRQVGGDVHLESQPGKGTTVTLLFPKAPVALPVTEV